ncbi:MAG: hypothetical protein Alis3KO_41510 [Aliiglaciecola sp.]
MTEKASYKYKITKGVQSVQRLQRFPASKIVEAGNTMAETRYVQLQELQQL